MPSFSITVETIRLTTLETVFNSDEYWVYERLKRYATRMETIPVPDLPKSEAIAALQRYRRRYFKESVSDEMLTHVYDQVGGRLSFLNRVAKAQDMKKTCKEICDAEKTWLLNRCWILGAEMDDDVMDEQKYSVCTVPCALLTWTTFLTAHSLQRWY